MGFGPMMSSLLRSKTGPLLVSLQIAVTLAIVINSLFIVLQRVEKINRDTGMDVDNVIIAYVRGFGENFDVVDSIRNDIDLLKNIPGVIAVSVTNQVPLSGSGSGSGLRAVPDETIDAAPAGRYTWSDKGLDALGVELTRGRNFYPEEIEYILPEGESPAQDSILITQSLADELFPDDDALGKTVYWGSMEPSIIVGIIGHMHGSWVGWDKLTNVVIQPGIYAYTTNKFMIRVEPGMRNELMPLIEQQLGESNRQRVVKSVRSLEEMAARSYRRDRGMAIILGIVITLLTQRTKQIGTRRALGAKKRDIIKQFVLENWIITTAGALLGAVLTVVVAYWLETSFSLPRLDWSYLPIGIASLWVLSTLAVIEPARRAAAVPPAVATRSV